MVEALVRSALHHRVVVVVVAVAMLFFGVRAAQNLSVDAFPDVTTVQVQVATEAPGRSPEEVERFITVPIEIAMTGLPGLTEMRSLIKPSLGIVTLVFEDDVNVYFARQLVNERLLEAKEKFPAGITPVLGPVSSVLGEVYQYTLERPDDGERPLSKEELIERRIVQDWIARPLLRSIPGIAEINSVGGYVKQYQVLADPIKLRYYQVSLRDISDALSRNNANSGGGILRQESEQYLIRGLGLINDLDDIRNIVIKEVGATPVYMRDLADVRFGEEVRYGALLKGGYTESVGGIVMMLAGGNAKQVVSRVQQRVKEINEQGLLPDGLKIVPFYDRSELVDAALNTVVKVLIEGVILVVIILFLFLGDLRSSIVVIATLVLTPLLTFMVMNQVNLSANLMSLGGLAIAIGLMVDGSVVVVENVFEKLGHHKDKSKLEVVFEAVREVGTPVVFGIGVIILVFLPLMTLEGMEGKMFRPLAYTIAIALFISLVLSLSLSPVLSAFLVKGGGGHDTFFLRILKFPYTRILNFALGNRIITVLAAVLLFVGSASLFPYLGTSFIPEMKEGSLAPNVDRVPNISLEESIRMEFRMQQLMRGIPGIKSIVSTLGRGESPADPNGVNENAIITGLLPIDQRPKGWDQERITEEVRNRLRRIPGANVVMAQPISDRVDEMVTGVRADVAVKIFGDDLQVLLEKANEIAKVARKVRGTQDIKVDRLGGQQYLTLDIDRQAIARFGLNVADLHDLIETAIGGKVVSEVYEGERRFAAIVRFPEQLRNSVDEIRRLVVNTPSFEKVYLENLARVDVVEGPAQINRESAKRRIVVGVNVADRDLGGFVAELQQMVARDVKLPSGYYLEWGGQFQNMERALNHLAFIVPVTIGAIFFLLFLLFGNLRFASLIILVLPFASMGGVIALFWTGEYLSVPASVGFIALWGIAVLNGVVLVSYIRKLREEGRTQAEAIREGALLRFRPVMMTATVAALGLVPFLFAVGPGSEVQRPLAIVVIGGLFTSTALTLVVLPALYAFFEGKEKTVEPLPLPKAAS
ncbi:MAG: CusA/CzcA family heavy metal efflux RND transporter [Bryobacter sp.]|nr:CusA/CzcA family heavy metal efflux RND transporter [Bryobacter sp.]